MQTHLINDFHHVFLQVFFGNHGNPVDDVRAYVAFYLKGQNFSALDYGTRALQRREAKLPNNHDDLLASWRQVASIHQHSGDDERAAMYLEKVYLALQSEDALEEIQSLLVNIWRLKLKTLDRPSLLLLTALEKLWNGQEIMQQNLPLVVQGTSRRPPSEYLEEILDLGLELMKIVSSTDDATTQQKTIDDAPRGNETLGQLACVMLLCA